MKLSYEQEPNGMYKLHKTDFDDIALMLLREYLASVVDSPGEVDINYLIKDCLYLDVYCKNLSANKSILGLVAFEDTTIPCYNLHFEPTTFDLVAGNIVLDMSLSGQRQLPRRRFTLAHELSHWILHRSYHSPSNQVFALKKVGYLPCGESEISIKKKALVTESDKEEWQANSLAAAILMPKFAFLHCAYQELRQHFGTGAAVFSETVDHDKYKAAVGNIAAVFNVSFQATEIRLDQFNLIA
ncbi:MAG: hypothetical protein BGN88_08445 [Clostridiales bacterium 43-6]|nr:MAG: hypothetical protein BGN88_08445 [Clostridiales bacterium 43-6]